MYTTDRIPLGFFPTPFHELKNLSRRLNGPNIFIKRDDLTGLALGGNKVRKLEYILAEAMSKKADVIITIGAVSSNHVRQTAAAAAILGLECQLVLIGHQPEEKQGNYLLDHLLGAKSYCVRNRDVEVTIHNLVDENKRNGKISYVIPAGGHNRLGAIAYRDGYLEMREQTDIHIDAIITAIGTGTSFAGLHLGCKQCCDATRIIGISVGGDREWCEKEILTICHEIEQESNIPLSSKKDLHIYEDYIGEGYTRPYPRLREVIELLARTEGILLDPVYTGKAMVGLLDLIEKKVFVKGQNIVFLHTGGAPELFSMNSFLCENE